VGRYVFTERDLEPLRNILDTAIGRQFVAAAIPIVEASRRAGRVEEVRPGPPVDIMSRAKPDGVPLHEILRAAQEKVPGVEAMALTGGRISITYAEGTSAADRKKIDELLADRATLEAMRPARPPVQPGPIAPDIERIVRDPATPDAAWLRAFRTYATGRLLEPPP
jgi:hypothetical protein